MVESVEKIRDKRRAWTRRGQRVLESKFLEIANKAIGCVLAESQGVAPEVPLESDDGEGSHASPDHAQRRLSSCKTRVEEAETWYHDKHHCRGDNDVCLISCLEPLVQVFGVYVSVRMAIPLNQDVRIEYALESPPSASLVPLKVVGAPTQEYDMLADLGSRSQE